MRNLQSFNEHSGVIKVFGNIAFVQLDSISGIPNGYAPIGKLSEIDEKLAEELVEKREKYYYPNIYVCYTPHWKYAKHKGSGCRTAKASLESLAQSLNLNPDADILVLRKTSMSEGRLNESVNDVMYHFTYVHKLYNILKTNELQLSPSFINPSDNKGENLYFLSLSTTRSLEIGYGASLGSDQIVRLTMDGRALNYNYKSKAVDYWQHSRTPKDKNSDLKTASRFDEMEERILTDKSSIKPASKYISSIEVLNGKPEQLPILKKIAIDLNIPFYAYDDKKYFNGSVKSKALGVIPAEGELYKDSNRRDGLSSLAKILAYLTYKDDELKEKVFAGLSKFDLDLEKLKGRISEIQGDKIKNYLRVDSDYYVTDLANSLQADLHNDKNSTNSIMRYVIREFGLDMKKHNTKSVKEYLKYKVWRGKKTQKQFNEEFNDKVLNLVDRQYKEKMNELKEYGYYAEVGDEYYDNVYDYPPIKNLLDSKIEKLKEFYSNYILKNDDMFKYNYYMSGDYACKELGIGKYSDDKYDPQFDSVLNGIDSSRDITARDLMQILNYGVISYVDDFTRDEIPRMQEEYNKQFQ